MNLRQKIDAADAVNREFIRQRMPAGLDQQGRHETRQPAEAATELGADTLPGDGSRAVVGMAVCAICAVAVCALLVTVFA